MTALVGLDEDGLEVQQVPLPRTAVAPCRFSAARTHRRHQRGEPRLQPMAALTASRKPVLRIRFPQDLVVRSFVRTS